MQNNHIARSLKELVLETLKDFKVHNWDGSSDISELSKTKTVLRDTAIEEQVLLGSSSICPFSIDSDVFLHAIREKVEHISTNQVDAYDSFDFSMTINDKSIEVRCLNSYDNDDVYENNHIYDIAFLANNHCFVCSININLENDLYVFDVDVYRSIEELDTSFLNYKGKRSLYSYPRLGVSLKFEGDPSAHEIKPHRVHQQAKNWGSAPRHFYQTIEVQTD
ncbi:hypothetical protein [Vibrio sp. D431a]|uniref:hypothetical protein n=1 Tax=Vibrio sp. D431a TaxID=2837388 RepID=UPI002555218D|nr:hypothetical protein [Vibrio sp. D431a]MDK9789958.1 hypothetical protein [Vibrio sp. D431a]